MAFDFSLQKVDSFTPIRPQKLEQLFSPNLKTLGQNIGSGSGRHDLTFRVPQMHKDQDLSLDLPLIADKFPRHSTGLKGSAKLMTETQVRELANAANNLSGSRSASFSESFIDQPSTNNHDNDDEPLPKYSPMQQIRESQPIRAICFHPTGDVYVVGSNSKTLRLCIYPSEEEHQNFAGDSQPLEPDLAFTFLQIHRGSIYCAAFNSSGNLLASGSNDQTVHVIKYNAHKRMPESNDYTMSMHTGTVRDLCFLPGGSEPNSSLLVSAGSGSYEIFVTDCQRMEQVQALQGHESCVMSVHCWDDANMFFSGSRDGVIRLWDARSKVCAKVVDTGRLLGDVSLRAPVGVVRAESTGKLLACGLTDGRCLLYDVKGGRLVQSFKAHDNEIRTLSFSPKSYYLLTGSYDRRIKMMDLQGDLTQPLPCVEIAELGGKVVQAAWHPIDYNFVSTSADGVANLWTMPGMVH